MFWLCSGLVLSVPLLGPLSSPRPLPLPNCWQMHRNQHAQTYSLTRHLYTAIFCIHLIISSSRSSYWPLQQAAGLGLCPLTGHTALAVSYSLNRAHPSNQTHNPETQQAGPHRIKHCMTSQHTRAGQLLTQLLSFTMKIPY